MRRLGRISIISTRPIALSHIQSFTRFYPTTELKTIRPYKKSGLAEVGIAECSTSDLTSSMPKNHKSENKINEDSEIRASSTMTELDKHNEIIKKFKELSSLYSKRML